MARADREKPDATNYGLQNKDMAYAAINALKEEGYSYQSVASMSDRFNQFAAHMKGEYGIKDMRSVERSHVLEYAQHIQGRVNAGELSVSTAHNYISAVNKVLEIARGDRELHVGAVRDAGLDRRDNICKESKSSTPEQHQNAVNSVSGRLGVMIELQRSLGLRFEESAKIDAKQAVKEALNKQQVTIVKGTKGGRSRTVPITKIEQVEKLKAAAGYQQNNQSLIPAHQSYAQFRKECYKQVEQNHKFHSGRHAYAQQRYETLTGAQSPVVAGVAHGREHQGYLAAKLNITAAEAVRLDKAARLIIAKELGHSRTSVTNNYLG